MDCMDKFQVLVRGENLLLQVEGETGRYGFYTTVSVEALHAADAAERALEVLREDPKLTRGLLNPGDDPVRLFPEEIAEIASFGRPAPYRNGLALFPEE